MDLKAEIKKVKQAAPALAASSEESRNKALDAICKALLKHKEQIFAANKEDMEQAEKDGVATPVMKRLKFDEGKILKGNYSVKKQEVIL